MMPSSSAADQDVDGGLEVLEANLAELENSVYHLVRSNVELAQFLEESPGDADLEQALLENKEILLKKRDQVKSLRNAISDLKTCRPHVAGTITRVQNTAARAASVGIASESAASDAPSISRSDGGTVAVSVGHSPSSDNCGLGVTGPDDSARAGDISGSVGSMSLEDATASPPTIPVAHSSSRGSQGFAPGGPAPGPEGSGDAIGVML